MAEIEDNAETLPVRRRLPDEREASCITSTLAGMKGI